MKIPRRSPEAIGHFYDLKIPATNLFSFEKRLASGIFDRGNTSQ